MSPKLLGNPQGFSGFGGGVGVGGATEPLPLIVISAHALKVSCLLSDRPQLLPAV